MKVLVLSVFVSLMVFVQSKPGGKYSSKFDAIDVEEIFRSDRLITNYFNCFMERGHCTPQGDEIRENLPDVIANECEKCTERQRDNGKRTLDFLINDRPELYSELEAKYDKEGTYKKKHDENKKKSN